MPRASKGAGRPAPSWASAAGPASLPGWVPAAPPACPGPSPSPCSQQALAAHWPAQEPGSLSTLPRTPGSRGSRADRCRVAERTSSHGNCFSWAWPAWQSCSLGRRLGPGGRWRASWPPCRTAGWGAGAPGFQRPQWRNPCPPPFPSGLAPARGGGQLPGQPGLLLRALGFGQSPGLGHARVHFTACLWGVLRTRGGLRFQSDAFLGTQLRNRNSCFAPVCLLSPKEEQP